MSAYVLLEDGARFDGDAVGAEGHAVGEVVFTTGMSGYQESMTDPSFAGQLITFTYPHIGNYGVSQAAMESDRIWARAAIMREATNREDAPGAEAGWCDWLTDCGIVAISGVDTRALVMHIRDAGAMRGGVFPGEMAESTARELIAAEPSMAGSDFVREVTPQTMSVHGESNVGGPRIVAIDTGIKLSIVRNFVERGAVLELHPATTPASELLSRDADAYFLANGPGDPSTLDYVVDTLRELIGQKPTFGICLGHQLMCRAVGLETFKLPFGHRGANHPVKRMADGVVEITSMNHGFAVDNTPGALGDNVIETHVSLFDGSNCGIAVKDKRAFGVQYHPEASPGPQDSFYLFEKFVGMLG